MLLQAGVVTALLVQRARRRRAEASLRAQESRLRAVLDSAVEGIITIDQQGIIESANVSARRMFGYAEPELIGLHISTIMPVPNRGDHLQKAAPKATGRGREASGLRKDGSSFPVDIAMSEVLVGNRRSFTGFVRDITERKEAERAAREFSGRLIHAQEEERARLARELHDDITQRLARLAIDTGRAEHEGIGRRIGEKIREVREGLVRLSEDVHGLSYRLHPSILDDLGLGEALKAECGRVSRPGTCEATLMMREVPEDVPRDVALCLYRVTQESLRNASRHSHARAVEVTLRGMEGGLQLAVHDDGVGFDATLPRHRHSLGLASMRERLRLVGGELDIDSVEGQGTTIIAWVPLDSSPT
jgi:PAS domain S-box-containing protein